MVRRGTKQKERESRRAVYIFDLRADLMANTGTLSVVKLLGKHAVSSKEQSFFAEFSRAIIRYIAGSDRRPKELEITGCYFIIFR